MLNIFYARERIDKEKFIYGKIAERRGETLVIVPDQYTLEAEKQAFKHLQVKGLMDLEIISMSRLGYKLLSEQGAGSRTFIDKYGRHMLLSKILSDVEEELQVFRSVKRRDSFIELANNFISEMKQYNVTSDDLAVMIAGLPGESILSKKLLDLHIIFSEYEEAIEDKYTDSEDYIDLYMEKIATSEFIKGKTVWIYGFDSFAPKALDVIGRLIQCAEDVNAFITYDRDCRDEEIFDLTAMVMENLEAQADIYGVPCSRTEVGDEFTAKKNSKALETLESELYAIAPQIKGDFSGIHLVKAANMYSEAESAAAFILHLLRDEGLRCRDIVVICNDQAVRGSIISRVFEEWGIRLFDDKKRKVLNSPIAAFVTAMLEVCGRGYNTSDIFKALKTGFTDINDEEIETLENYAIKYRIRGSMWKKPFVKGQLEYGDDGLEAINDIRKRTMDIFESCHSCMEKDQTVAGFVGDFYDFLVDEAHLADRIMELMTEQESQGLQDLADETSQVWGCIVGLFDQLTELAGENKFDVQEFTEMLISGLSQMEIGVLPQAVDDILMGTMQRTRCGDIKAAIVIGANEGVLPAGSSDSGLFNDEELELLAADGKPLCKVEGVRTMEEKLAIYRNLSKPSDHLWISYAASDEEGKETRPSEIVDAIKNIFPYITEEEDVVSRGEVKDLAGGRLSTLRHLSSALRTASKGEKIDGTWQQVIEWYRENDPDTFAKIEKGLEFTNKQSPLEENLLRQLYIKEGQMDLALSPSRLEKFSRCPFAHFVAYGLRPEERRVFEAAGREIGDIYHRCLMELSEILTRTQGWDTVTEEECRELIQHITRQETAAYREGVFHFSKEEEYKTKRVEEAAFHVSWALVEQVRAGEIEESKYEEAFGRGRNIPPIEVECNGETIYIEGKIDRLDVLSDGRVKIIDYKTGREHFDATEAKGGYRLQLMLYLKAAQEESRKPAGVFYFLIADPKSDVTGLGGEELAAKTTKDIKKSFRLDGVMVDDDEVIRSIAGEFDGISDIVPLRHNKDGQIKGTSEGVLLSEEEFEELQGQVDAQIEKLCGQLLDGKISITPKKTEKESPCTYCQYKGICRFDLDFPGCNFELIK